MDPGSSVAQQRPGVEGRPDGCDESVLDMAPVDRGKGAGVSDEVVPGHHVGHVGILGVDKQGAEFYQISIGGAQGNDTALGKVMGPSVCWTRNSTTWVEPRPSSE